MVYFSFNVNQLNLNVRNCTILSNCDSKFAFTHRKIILQTLPAGNLKGEGGAAERVIEDMFIRRFMFGTFHGCLANEIVIKRRGNILIVCALMLQKLPPYKFYFLIGYTESLLSHFYKCPVKLEIQTLQNKPVYKYL